jgi:hypothetical protein
MSYSDLTFKDLVKFLRGRKPTLVKYIEVSGVAHDPTYGNHSCLVSVEVIDFDALLAAIDEFSEGFRT